MIIFSSMYAFSLYFFLNAPKEMSSISGLFSSSFFLLLLASTFVEDFALLSLFLLATADPCISEAIFCTTDSKKEQAASLVNSMVVLCLSLILSSCYFSSRSFQYSLYSLPNREACLLRSLKILMALAIVSLFSPIAFCNAFFITSV